MAMKHTMYLRRLVDHAESVRAGGHDDQGTWRSSDRFPRPPAVVFDIYQDRWL